MMARTSGKRFFHLLSASGQNILAAAQAFQTLAQHPVQVRESAIQLKELEQKGDQLTHELIILLNRLFVTPLEREDILQLAQRLDDVVDGIEAVASRMAIYGLTREDGYVLEFSRIIEGQARQIAAAMDNLDGRQLARLRDHSVEINALENQGDETLRAALEHLFRHGQDAIRIIQLKEIYETLEVVTDRAEDVADVLESVVLKNG